MKRWMLPVTLCAFAFGACSNDWDLRGDSNEMGGATKPKTVSDKERADLLAALTSEKETVARLQKEIRGLRSQDQRVAELERKLREQEEELANLRPLVATREELDNVRSRVNILLASRQECQEELAQFKSPVKRNHSPSLVQLQQDLNTSLQNEITRGDIKVQPTSNHVMISLNAKALFDSGSADLRREGGDILQRVGAILKQFPDKKLTVTGYTDNLPIKGVLQKRFPSNKELSEARAASGAKALEHAGIDNGLVTIAGKGEAMPIASNGTLEGRAKNRRIEILVTNGRSLEANQGKDPEPMRRF